MQDTEVAERSDVGTPHASPAWQTYLQRCQVDTPESLVKATWEHVAQLRGRVGKVVDFGAGDGRFARSTHYDEYVGYEIDEKRCLDAVCPPNAKLLNLSAFDSDVEDADLCIGNPPFVRNQDLPEGWRETVAPKLARRTGITLSGLANAWQYFFLLSLCSVKADGLVALVIPYEWVSRPSASIIRDYIKAAGWGVSVYRLVEETFDSVLTTSSITIIDKANTTGSWRYFEELHDGTYSELKTPSGTEEGVIRYLRRAQSLSDGPKAIRGLSPGTQKVLTLTEGERARLGLEIGVDVLPCVTTLRHLSGEISNLDQATFKAVFRNGDAKCWLINTESHPSKRLQAYLQSIPATDYQTATCLEREVWWKFRMPKVPDLLMAMSFKGSFPKVVRNSYRVHAVGGVCGIHGAREEHVSVLLNGLDGMDLRGRVVPHSNGLRKIEIGQMNALLFDRFGQTAGDDG